MPCSFGFNEEIVDLKHFWEILLICIELEQNSELLYWNWKVCFMLSEATNVCIILRL